LAGQVIAELDSNPLTTFVTLLLKEEHKQSGSTKDGLVDDNQCKK
jgi:hypothetical protein